MPRCQKLLVQVFRVLVAAANGEFGSGFLQSISAPGKWKREPAAASSGARCCWNEGSEATLGPRAKPVGTTSSLMGAGNLL